MGNHLSYSCVSRSFIFIIKAFIHYEKIFNFLPLIISCNGLGRSNMLGGEISQHGESETTNRGNDMDASLFIKSAMTIASNLLDVPKH